MSSINNFVSTNQPPYTERVRQLLQQSWQENKYQAARGVRSHFNYTTPFDALLFNIMGGMIMLLGITTLVALILLARQKLPDPAFGLALKWGLLIGFIGASLAAFEVGKQRFRHWFDGAAMLHRFAFENGRVSYANKYLQTPGYKGNLATGKISYSEFATDPCRTIFQRFTTMFSGGGGAPYNTNVNLTKLAGQFLAMTETPLPVAFDLNTLETVGVVQFGDQLGYQSTTAHPHFDPVRNAGVNHLIEYGRQSTYSFAFIPNERPLRRQIINHIPVNEPGYVHSFGMTEHYLILAEFPYVANPLHMLISGKPFIENFAWRPERGARFLVIDKASGELLRTHTADAFFAFHHVNAYEEGEDIMVDLSAYDDASLVKELYLDRLRGKDGGRLSFGEFRRYRLVAGRERADYEALSEQMFELPRINYRYNGRPYRYAYACSRRPGTDNDFLNALVKVDLLAAMNNETMNNETMNNEQLLPGVTQRATRLRGGPGEWRSSLWSEKGSYPGEPVFVAAPHATREDEGVLLSVVLDSKAGNSFLLVLDAADFSEVARAAVPHHVPFGFHGQFFGE